MYFSTFCPSKLPPSPSDPPPFPSGEGVLFYFFATLSRQPSTLDNKARALGTDERVNWVFVRGIISLISLTYQSLTFRSSYVRIISIAPRATSSSCHPLTNGSGQARTPSADTRVSSRFLKMKASATCQEDWKMSDPPDVIIASILLKRFLEFDLPQSRVISPRRLFDIQQLATREISASYI